MTSPSVVTVHESPESSYPNTERFFMPSIARSSGGPTGSPRWYIISFCTTTPRFHIGACNTSGGSNGPFGQYVKPPGEPRYHHVMTCAIFTRYASNKPDLPMMFWSQTGVFSIRTPRKVTASKCGARPVLCGPQMLNSISVGLAYCAPQYDFTSSRNRAL